MMKVWRERKEWLVSGAVPTPAPPPGSNLVDLPPSGENNTEEALDKLIYAVVDFFSAPHLMPSTIRQQMQAGNSLACHSLLSLAKYLQKNQDFGVLGNVGGKGEL